MANLAVYIELGTDGEATAACAFALGQARNISNLLGATVYALVPTIDGGAAELDLLALGLGLGGADRVLACQVDWDTQKPPYSSAGPLLEAVVTKLRPRVFLFPQSHAPLASELAKRVLAEFIANAQVSLAPGNPNDDVNATFHLQRLDNSETRVQGLDVLDTDRLVVCTLHPGPPPTASGGGEAEVELLSFASARPPG